MDETTGIMTRRGTVIFLESHQGSKSEAVLPYLYESSDSCVRIMLKGDNPFENAGLRPYDGRLVEIRGVKGRGKIFIVQEIAEIGPAASGAAEGPAAAEVSED